MKVTLNLCARYSGLNIWGLFLIGSLNPILLYGATAPTIKLPKRTFTVFSADVSPTLVAKNDGESAQFQDIVLPSKITVSAWSWDFSVPAGAGNSPACVFTPSNAKATIIANSRWYAYPDDSCAAALISDYTVKSKVIILGKEYDAESGILRVTLPVEIGNVAVSLSGYPDIGTTDDGGIFVWYVAGIGTLVRTVTQPTINVPQTSQFYNKVVAHENQHVVDYTTGIAKDLWAVEDFYPHIQGLTASTKEELEQLIAIVTETYKVNEVNEFKAIEAQLEINAYTVSDLIPPNYIYTNCP